MHAISADLEIAARAARRAGDVILRHFRTELDVVHKAPDQPLTQADLEADALLREQLLRARPGYGWLSEETADSPDRLGRRRVWIVDPIDGTRSFIAGRPEFAISIGMAEDGVVLAGVVFNPARDELYTAARGGGAFVEEAGSAPRRLAVAAPGRAPVLLASRSEMAAGEFDALRADFGVSPLGSTAYKLVRVAAGAAEAFLSRGPKSEWDICAGTLIVTEAGGRVTNLAGAEPAFNREDPSVDGIVATNGAMHDDLLRRIAGLPPVGRRWAGGAAGGRGGEA